MHNYLENLTMKFKAYFDLYYGYEFLNNRLDFFATNHTRNEKYFATKNIPIWAVETNEFCLLQIQESIDIEELKEFTNFLKRSVDKLVFPNKNHMKTVVNGVLVSKSPVTKDSILLVNKFKYSKVFKFYLEGWCEIRLLLVELPTQHVYTNKKGKEVMEIYRPQGRALA